MQPVAKLLVLPFLLFAAQPFHSSIKPLPSSVRAELKAHHFWHQGCPVGLSGLRVLTVTYRGFDGASHTGQLVTNANAAPKLALVFHQLYRLHFPIRHMKLSDAYGPKSAWPADGDVTASFECRNAVPSTDRWATASV